MKKRQYHEINTYPDPSFPVQIYKVNKNGTYPLGRGLRDFHWHDELQFTLAVQGELTVQVNGIQYILNEGDAIFINSGMIHATIKLSVGGCYTSLNFPYKLISFFPGSRMESEYVLPYVTGNCTSVIVFHQDNEEQKKVLEILQKINNSWNNDFLKQKEYVIATEIATLWRTVLVNLSDKSKTGVYVDIIGRQRLQNMLSFIYEHFSEDITLSDISSTANISIGECCRIFKSHLQISPYQFLTHYRVRKSIEFLSGELSISEIARCCGYNQVSNYIAKFKSIMDCTPTQYRRRSE